MAGAANVSTSLTVTGLGASRTQDNSFAATVPTAVTSQYLVQTTTDVGELLPLGDVSTVQGVLIKAITNDAYIDTTFDTDFSNEIELIAGQSVYFKPVGAVYFINKTANPAVVTLDYTVFGTV